MAGQVCEVFVKIPMPGLWNHGTLGALFLLINSSCLNGSEAVLFIFSLAVFQMIRMGIFSA